MSGPSCFVRLYATPKTSGRQEHNACNQLGLAKLANRRQMIVGQLAKRDGLAFDVKNGVTGERLRVARLTHGARVDETGTRTSQLVITGPGHQMKPAVGREQCCVMGVPANQHRGFGRDRTKLRKRRFGLLARAYIRVGAQEVAVADDLATCRKQ